MAFDELPEKILVRILSFLPLSDLLESALTCRRWAQAVATPPLLRNIWLVIEDMKEAGTVFVNTRRQYQNLRLYRASLPDFDVAFWTNVGPSLRKLEIIDSECSFEGFHSILKACCNLESLKLRESRTECDASSTASSELSELPPTDVESIQESMRNLHHLHLDFCSLRVEALEYMLVLMPNVSSLGLRLNGVESNLLSRLPNILGTSRRITMLQLYRRTINGEEFEQLLRATSASSRELAFCDGQRTLPRAVEYCTMLRDLNINCLSLDAHSLQKILGCVPELESLKITIHRGSQLTREDLLPLFDLKKLRKLHLDVRLEIDPYGCVKKEILRGIARMLSLESFVAEQRAGAVDSAGFRILASLPKLRNLALTFIKQNAVFFRKILFESRKLKTLSIRGHTLWNPLYSEPFVDSELLGKFLGIADRFESDRQDELESSLEVLEFRDVSLDDTCLGLIAQHTRLKVLRINNCYFITDSELVNLLEKEPLLEELELYNGDNLNGEFLEALGELPCRRLRSLRIHPRDAISSEVWEAFKLRKPRVKCSFASSQ